MASDKSDDPKEDGSSENTSQKKISSAEERSEYFQKLEKWLHEAYAWQSVTAMFQHYMISDQILNPSSGIPSFPPSNVNVSNAQRLVINNYDEWNESLRQRRVAQVPVGLAVQPVGAEGLEYRIPPIWKRFAAEFIDSTMLFLLRFFITFVVIDVFHFMYVHVVTHQDAILSVFYVRQNSVATVGISPFCRHIDDLDLLQTNLRIDYTMALEMTYGILVLEIIYRVIVCIFEAFWLQHGVNGRIGGVTPGKSMMGLRVVQCRSVTPVERPDDPDVVLVSPGTDLGLPLALGRSVVKNLILAFLFPICFALFFFRFNRTGYDLICNSIVVEDPYRNINNNRVHRQ